MGIVKAVARHAILSVIVSVSVMATGHAYFYFFG